MSLPLVSSTPVRAVLFDYGMVLSGPPDPAAWERISAAFAAERENMHAAYWHFRHDYDRGALNARRYWQAVADELGDQMDEAKIQELIAADVALWTVPNQEMIDWAADLQRAGIKTGILSNIGDAMEEGILAQCGWLCEFAHHTFSHRLGTAKPDPAIYLHAVKGLGVAPQEVLFIDDREDNIAAAAATGMKAVRYTGHNSFVREMRERGFGHLLQLRS